MKKMDGQMDADGRRIESAQRFVRDLVSKSGGDTERAARFIGRVSRMSIGEARSLVAKYNRGGLD